MGTVPQIGKNIFYASQSGCKLDCVMTTGKNSAGSAATDDTAALQALLTYAASLGTVGAKVVLDGCALVTGLTVPGNITIEGTGWDSGLYLKDASNAVPLTVGPASGTAYNVTLRNFQINGNQPNQTGSSVNLLVKNITHLSLERFFSYSPTTFNALFETCVDIVIDGSRFESPTDGTPAGTDGVHFESGCANIRVDNCYFRTNDDAIAVNAPEGVGAEIQNVAVSNCVFANCASGMRVYGWESSGDEQTVAGVVVSNCVGVFSSATYGHCAVHYFGYGSGTKPLDTVQDFTGVGFTFRGVTNAVWFGEPCGDVTFKGYKWMAPGGANPFFTFSNTNAQVSSLLIEGCGIYRNTAGNSAAFLLNAGGQAGSLIKKLTIRGFGIDNEQGQSYAAIATLIQMADLAITELVIDALDCTLITAIVDDFTNVGSVSGAGVLATGLNFPDSVMANGTPYLSATSPNVGKPCIKLGGTVYPFTI